MKENSSDLKRLCDKLEKLKSTSLQKNYKEAKRILEALEEDYRNSTGKDLPEGIHEELKDIVSGKTAHKIERKVSGKDEEMEI